MKIENKWFTKEEWEACGEDYCPSSLSGGTCFAGFWFCNKRGVASLVLVFPAVGSYEQLAWHWIYHRTAETEPFSGIMFGSNMIIEDFSTNSILNQIGKLGLLFDVEELAYDPWNCELLAKELPFKKRPFVFSKTNYDTATWRYADLVRKGKMKHNRDELLSWQATNAIVGKDGSLLHKTVPDSSFTDGVVAAIMATNHALEWPHLT